MEGQSLRKAEEQAYGSRAQRDQPGLKSVLSDPRHVRFPPAASQNAAKSPGGLAWGNTAFPWDRTELSWMGTWGRACSY